ncbi:hypothetical protein GQX73_g2739 [Xylaria multiplex]|uniref:Uncharacterized protein n=1 Tax=Xylaria multiplex TaxID=323545 RepID=A0A7C8IUP5_9PEZI|nr:hypothetical protein GQX73_g2739 [Xylaria multiplex]
MPSISTFTLYFKWDLAPNMSIGKQFRITSDSMNWRALSATNNATPGETFLEYAVQTADLTRLIRACDQTGDLGYPNLSTVEQRAAFMAHGRTKQDPLQHKNRDELNSLRIPLLEGEERFKARYILIQHLKPAPDEISQDREPDLDFPMGDYGDDDNDDNDVDYGNFNESD